MTSRLPCYLGIAILSCNAAFAAAPAPLPQLNPPFNIAQQRAAHGAPNRLMRVTCGKIPKAIVRLDTNSVYDQKDKTRSNIDSKAQKQYLAMIQPVRDYISRITKMANAYVQESPPHPEVAMCVMRWIHGWANRKAFSELTTKQAKMGFGPTLSAMALSYMQVQNDPGLPPESHKKIRAWLITLAKQQIAYYEANESSNSSFANHRYWGGLGVAAVGIATGNKKFLSWGIDSARIGIEQITPEGFLPRELARAKKARDYHLYATAPLIMLAEMAAANGVDLYQENDGALHRLVAATVHSVTDPSRLQERAQNQMIPLPDGKVTANRLAWLEIYHSRFASMEHETMLNRYRPLSNSGLGGSTTLLFSK